MQCKTESGTSAINSYARKTPDLVELLGAQLGSELHDYVLKLRHQAQAIPFLTGSPPDLSLN